MRSALLFFLNARVEPSNELTLFKVRKASETQWKGGGSLVKEQLNHSQNSSTSVKLIEKPFITGCLSDMLAVCHLSPECPYYLWHIRCDVFCGSGNKLEPPTSTPSTDRSTSSACSIWSCLSLSLLLSFIPKGQMVWCVRIRLTEEVLIFVDDMYMISLCLTL